MRTSFATLSGKMRAYSRAIDLFPININLDTLAGVCYHVFRMGKVQTPKGKPTENKTEKPVEKAAEITPGNKTQTVKPKRTFKLVLKRYWYWFATIPLLFVLSFVWLYFLGVFDTVNAIVIQSATPESINLPVDSMYHIVVTSDIGVKPVYSSNHTSIAEVTQDGLIITHKEGTAVITASFGKKRYEVAVSVSGYGNTWYLTAGDTFDDNDVYSAFPSIAKSLQMVTTDTNGYIDSYLGEDGAVYTVTDKVKKEGTGLAFFYVYSAAEDESSDFEQKGVLTIRVVEDEKTKQEKQSAYQKYIFENEKSIEIPKDRVDEKLEIACGSTYDLLPTLKTEGFVRFEAEDVPDDFPIILTQTGQVSMDAMLSKFYINAVVGTGEVYRYECTATPRFMAITLQVGEEFIFEDHLDLFPSDIAEMEQKNFVSASDKLQEIRDDFNKLIGFKAVEKTQEYAYLNFSPYGNEKYVTFRLVVSISDDDPGGNNA